jgi:hypothetical protein
MFDMKSKILEQIMDLADEAMMKKAAGKKKPAMMAMSVEACAPKGEEKEEKGESESDLSPEDLKTLLSQLAE